MPAATGSPLIDLDRFKLTLGGFIRTIMNRVDYYAMYPCTVASQNADGSLELVPDVKSKLGAGLSAVKYKPGIPGVTVTVNAGARVLLGWENGDPSRPFAALWDQLSTVAKTSILATEVDVGGSTDFQIKGSTFITAFNTFNAALISATTVANVVAAATALQTALGGVGLPSALSTVAKNG